MAYSKRYVDGGGLLGIPWSTVFVFGFALFFFSKLRDAISNLFTWGTGKDSQESKSNEKAAIQAASIKIDQTKLSKPILHYTTVANMLYTAMDGAGTDKDKIRLLLEYNATEFKQIYKEFGVRKNTILYLTVMTGNLVEWIEYELNDIGDSDTLILLRKRFKSTGLW